MLAYYDNISIIGGILTLFVVVFGIYKYVPDATPKTWKWFGVHLCMATLLSVVVVILLHQSLSLADSALQGSLALTAVVLGQSLAFANQRSNLRRACATQTK